MPVQMRLVSAKTVALALTAFAGSAMGKVMMMSRWLLSVLLGVSILGFPIQGSALTVGPKLIPIQAFCASGPPTELFMGFMEHGAVPTHRLVLEGVGTLYIVQSREPATSVVIHNIKSNGGEGMTCMFWYTPFALEASGVEIPPLPEKKPDEEEA